MSVKKVLTKAGTIDYVDLDNSVCSTDILVPQGKVAKDTQIKEGLDTFKANMTIDSINGFASSTKFPTARSAYTMMARMTQGIAGGFLGNLTCAQVNALTQHRNGDNCVVTDSGTIILGSVVVVAGDKIAWTTEGAWVKELSPYVRDTDYATPSTGGTIKAYTNSTANAGKVGVNADGTAYVIGWDTYAKLDLSTCTETGLNNLLKKSGNGGGVSVADEELKVVAYDHSTSAVWNFTLGAIWSWIKGKLSSEADVNISGRSATSSASSKSYACHDNGSASAKTIKMWYKTDSGVTGAGDIQKVYPNTPTRALITNTNWLAAYCTNDDGTDIRSVNASDVTVGNAIDSTKINGHSIEVVSSGSSVSTTSGTISIVTFN